MKHRHPRTITTLLVAASLSALWPWWAEGGRPVDRKGDHQTIETEIDEGRGYLPEDLPLQPPPTRPWEETTGPVTGPSVVRLWGRKGAKDLTDLSARGALVGKSIYLSPGHGWYWTGSYWTTQRGNPYGIVEDLSNAEAVDQFLMDFLWRAGAQIVPMREVDTTETMVVCDDGDGSNHPEKCIFEELGDPSLFSDSTLAAYGRLAFPLGSSSAPFEAGGNRLLDVTETQTASFRWTFNVPESNWYGVWISYSSYSARAPDAHYIVHHAGGDAHFLVDQRHHGGTWILLGRFYFDAGTNPEHGSVELANDSAHVGPDRQVSADAVRLGGGMGIIDRGGGPSNKPRWEECCRYHAQFTGAPASIYNSSTGDDHTDDISCRSRLAAWTHETGEDSIYLSWHSNAGGGQGTSIYVYGSGGPGECTTPSPTPGSVALADTILAEVVGDLRLDWDPDWRDRGRHCAWFGELNPSHNGEMPAALIEVAFHDLPEDVAALSEPAFRRILARAIYQGIVRYFADRDNEQPHFLPEPPWGLSAVHRGPCSVELSWNPPVDDPAGGDPPEGYLVFMGTHGRAFGDPAQTTQETNLLIEDLEPGVVYYFRVAAFNQGGVSEKTRTVAVRLPGWPGRTSVLAIQGFGRLDSSQNLIRRESSALGRATRMIPARMNDGSYLVEHAKALAAYGAAFDSCEDQAFAAGTAPDLQDYDVVDLAAGRWADSDHVILPELRSALSEFVGQGGRLILSGSVLARGLASEGADAQQFAEQTLGIRSVPMEPTYEITGQDWLEGTWALSDDQGPAGTYDASPTESLEATGDLSTVAHFGSDRGTAALASDSLVVFDVPIETLSEPDQVLSPALQHLGAEQAHGTECNIPDAGTSDGSEDTDATPGDAGLQVDAACRTCPCSESGCSCGTTGPASGIEGMFWMIVAFFVLLVYARPGRFS